MRIARSKASVASRACQQGTSLVEVLVTVVILTLGIVAMAELQATALRVNQSSYLRTQAVALSYQILDAMRANREAALNGEYDWSIGDPAPTAAQATTIARSDLRAWLTAIENTMRPFDGSGGVVRDVNNVDRFTITIEWQNRHATEVLNLTHPRITRLGVVAEL